MLQAVMASRRAAERVLQLQVAVWVLQARDLFLRPGQLSVTGLDRAPSVGCSVGRFLTFVGFPRSYCSNFYRSTTS
jgi:hypothetical protein